MSLLCEKDVVIFANLYYTKRAILILGGRTMKNTSTWRFVMKIVGLSLVLAGMICVVIGCWDQLTDGVSTVAGKIRSRRCPEFDDYDDDLLCE